MSELDTLMNLADTMSGEAFKPINEFIETIMGLEDDALTDEVVEALAGMITGAFTSSMKNEGAQAIVDRFAENGLTRTQVNAAVNNFKGSIGELLDDLKPSQNKLALLNAVFNQILEIYDLAVERYHNYDIELPIQLDEGAQMPKYAHTDDAAADVYAIEDQVIPAHSFSNVVHTGVRFGTPED